MITLLKSRHVQWAPLLLCLLLAGCDLDNNGNKDPDPNNPPPPAPTAVAREVNKDSDLLTGPLARGSVGDYVLENELVRVIIQKPGRQWMGLGTYGGNIIDVARKQADGSYLPDHLEEFAIGINIENTANYTQVTITNPGADGEEAQICARGPDDLLEYSNASSKIRDFGFPFPDSADDRDLPLDIETCYSLGANQSYVTMDTRLINTTGEDVKLWWVEYLNGSGEVQAFQPQVGFNEPLFTAGCPAPSTAACESGDCDLCNYLAYAGHDGAAGVSYGFIHETPDSSSFSTQGFNVLLLGTSLVKIVAGEEPNFTVPANGEFSLRRYFAIGDGSASSIADIRNQIDGIYTGELTGTVSSSGEAVANASVAVFQTINANTNPPTLFVVANASTDADGNFSMSLPPGDYQVQANAEGYLFASDTPAEVTVARDSRVRQDFALPVPGKLQVSVMSSQLDGGNGPGPAKLQVLGFDPSPWQGNLPGVFGDDSNRLPYGVTLVAFIDRDGSTGELTLEPGDYQVVVSRGPRYSVYRKNISVSAGQTTRVDAQLAQVMSTGGFVYGDFHVHSIDSIDAEVTRSERVATYLAEGMDFFTPSDHDINVDFTSTLVNMEVTDLIGTAPSSEATTFDYGHFNSWPVTIDSQKLGGGTLDWGKEAEPGMDFPEYGSYNLTPADIFTRTLADPKANIIQINHVDSFFGAGGLGIDTGQTPPRSSVDPAQRRLDPAIDNSFDDGFQALEVWIGTNGRNGISQFLEQNVGNWFNLINQGIVRTGVANSDSHSHLTTHLATRNQTASQETDPGALSAYAETLASTVAAGRVVGTNAPYVTIEATATHRGVTRTAGLAINRETTVPVNTGSDVQVTVNIVAPAWAQVDSVDFYINNQPELTSAAGQTARYGVCADITVSAGDPGWSANEVVVNDAIPGASRNEIAVTARLSGVSEDSWLVAIVRGTDGVSIPLFPAVPEDLDEASNTTLDELTDDNLGEGGVLAFAFTNPLFLDVNGDGWVAPGVANANCSP